MKVNARRILSGMINSPNPQDILAALDALDRGAEAIASPNSVPPSELTRTWASRRAGPFLPRGKHKVVDALLVELGAGGTAPWVVHLIKTDEESFILFVDGRGVGRACFRMTP